MRAFVSVFAMSCAAEARVGKGAVDERLHGFYGVARGSPDYCDSVRGEDAYRARSHVSRDHMRDAGGGKVYRDS